MLAAYAAFQDWDGFYLFDYNGDKEGYNSSKIKGFFDIDTNPAKMAFLPAAATMFLRNDLAIANEELRMRFPKEKTAALLTKYGRTITPMWEAQGVTWKDALTHRLSIGITTGDTKPIAPKPPPTDPPAPTDIINPHNGNASIQWQVANVEKPVFLADSPSSKVMVGILGGRNTTVGGLALQLTETERNFAAVSLVAIDGQTTNLSRSMLLTIAGSIQNKGTIWNAARTSVTNNWGTGPTIAEPLKGTILIQTGLKKAIVYALDGTGKQRSKVTSKLENGFLNITIAPIDGTIWYEIVAE